MKRNLDFNAKSISQVTEQFLAREREERIFPEYTQFAGTLFARMTNSLGYNNHGARWHEVPLCLFLNLKSLTATSRILTSDEHLAFTEHLGKICPAFLFCSHSPPPSSALQLREFPQSLPGPCTTPGPALAVPCASCGG